MRAETIAEQMFFTTCHIEASSAATNWVGTGFVYAVETNLGTAQFLVTNKHILEDAEKVTVRMIRRDNSGQPWLGNATQVTVQSFNDTSWRGHPNPAVDVGVMSLAALLQQMDKLNAVPFFRAVSPEMCLSRAQEQELDAIEDVNFIGYPSGLYDAKNYLPILRTGTTATPISVDYEGVPAFLIDASVFPGSSGSPVFIANRGTYLTRDKGVIVGNRIICLGVLAAVHTRQVEGSVNVLPSRLITTFDEPIDLGLVFKAGCIDECVQPILEQAGLSRVQAGALVEASAEPTPADDAIADAGTAD